MAPHEATPTIIDSFTGEWFFLSNFSPSPVVLDGDSYPTIEHAYQAAKTSDQEKRAQIRSAPTPDEAKTRGRALADRPEFMAIRLDVMRDLVEQKFQDLGFGRKLLSTREAILVERNDWGDTFWGVCNNVGHNFMGRILMTTRDNLRRGLRGSMDTVRNMATAVVPTQHGLFQCYAFLVNELDHIALVRGIVAGREGVLVRVHSECVTGEAFGSLRCDCKAQLDAALGLLAREGNGALIYLRGHEGRGVGLIDKVRAYALQDVGLDTVEAQLALGLPVDARTFEAASAMISALDIRSVRLITNNPAKRQQLEQCGIFVSELIPLMIPESTHSTQYLETKRARLGHLLPQRSADD